MTLSRRNFFSELGVFGAILWKEYKHFTRYPLTIVGYFLTPILWIIPVILVGELFAGAENTQGFHTYTGIEDFRSFLILGTILWNLIASIFFGIGFSLKIEMWQGTLEQNWIAPIRRSEILMARSFFNILVNIIFTAIIVIFAFFFLGLQIGGSILLSLALILLTILICYGFGFIFSGIVLMVREPMAPAFVFMEIIPFLCGMMYPITVLPSFAQKLAKWIPFTYAIDGLRGVLLGSKTVFPIQQEIVILFFFALALPLVGYAGFSMIERRGRKQGSLGKY